MRPARHAQLYRRLTALYPRAFRHEYRHDLVSHFALQIDDDGAARSWLRVLRDLAVTVPTQHLEAHMRRPSTSLLVTICIAVAGASTALATIVGFSFYALALMLLALAAIALAVLIHRADRSPTERATYSWKTMLIGGVALLAGLIVLMNVPPIDDGIETDGVWYVLMLSLLTSFVMIIVGLIGGIASQFRGGASAGNAH